VERKIQASYDRVDSVSVREFRKMLHAMDGSAIAYKALRNFLSGVSRWAEVLRANGFAVKQMPPNPYS
jgi:hypothetical protein